MYSFSNDLVTPEKPRALACELTVLTGSISEILSTYYLHHLAHFPCNHRVFCYRMFFVVAGRVLVITIATKTEVEIVTLCTVDTTADYKRLALITLVHHVHDLMVLTLVTSIRYTP